MSVTKDDVRKVARLSRIAVSEERLEAMAGELTGIMGWIEQLNEVDIEGVEPMTSVVEVDMPKRSDEITDGGIRDQILANAPKSDDGFFRCAQGGGIDERSHIPQTLAAAIDGLKAKDFSSREITQDFLTAIETANPHLNAYVVETPEKAFAMADASDARLKDGKGGTLEGAPLGIKDLYCTKGVRTTAASNILGEFTPTYESHSDAEPLG